MASVKYLPIEKSVLKQGSKFEFNLFIPMDSNKEMTCFKKSGFPLNDEEKPLLDTIENFYVQESEYAIYEQFYKAHTPDRPPVKNVSFTEQSAHIYQNASEILNKLFNDPDNVANYEVCKEVVKEMIDTVSEEEFKIKSLMSAAPQDYYTHTHSINVAIYALSLGAFLKMKPNELAELGESALLHDLGKSKIDPAIVNKNGELTNNEYQEMKKHPALGYAIALKLNIRNKNILQGIRHHHERMDGTGYPFGMRDENIPLFAKIIGICDIFDALTSKKSYKEPLSTFEALKLMKTKMKKEIDIKLLDKMIIMFR